jgi:glycosyltransferase involved in cell wall biosynthesis
LPSFLLFANASIILSKKEIYRDYNSFKKVKDIAMYIYPSSPKKYNFGFISTRFAGTDGVSLETEKWSEVLKENGHNCFYFAGQCDRNPAISMTVPEANYRFPEVENHHRQFFGHEKRNREDTQWIHKMTQFLKSKLYQFQAHFNIDVLIPENCLAIPLHIPLGLAITEFIAETNIPTIAHHHDFSWERKRFLVNNVWDYLSMAFPPTLHAIHHVTINSSGRHQLARRKGVASTIIPNVMQFEKPAPGIDDYNRDLRKTLGIRKDQLLFLQPTRVVQRKGIEHAIELISRLKMDAVLVISHASGDEGYEYEKRIRNYADLMDVHVIFASQFFDDKRGLTPDGEKVYSLWDVYPHADLVTYPSLVEGFGNAFLEAVYFRKPIIVNNYTIYTIDIRTKGFQVIEFDDYITDETVETTRHVLQDPDEVARMTNINYDLALKYFSYHVLESKLKELVENLVWD